MNHAGGNLVNTEEYLEVDVTTPRLNDYAFQSLRERFPRAFKRRMSCGSEVSYGTSFYGTPKSTTSYTPRSRSRHNSAWTQNSMMPTTSSPSFTTHRKMSLNGLPQKPTSGVRRTVRTEGHRSRSNSITNIHMQSYTPPIVKESRAAITANNVYSILKKHRSPSPTGPQRYEQWDKVYLSGCESLKDRLQRNHETMKKLFSKEHNRYRKNSHDQDDTSSSVVSTNISYRPPMSTSRKTRAARQAESSKRFASPGSSSHDSAVELDGTESQQSSPFSSENIHKTTSQTALNTEHPTSNTIPYTEDMGNRGNITILSIITYCLW